MAFNDASKLYDILFVLETESFVYHFKSTNTTQTYLGQDHYPNLDEALHGIGKTRKFYLVTSGEHFFHEEICVDFALNDDTLLRSLFDEQLEKNPSLNEPLVYNYEALPAIKNENKSCYQIFGFHKSDYEKLEATLDNNAQLQLLTSSRQVLFNFVKQHTVTNEPFIALYRFMDIDIMVVCKFEQLLFSRVHHYGNEKDDEDLVRSLNYVIQRFKVEDVNLYLGGALLKSQTVQARINEATNLTIKPLPAQKQFPNLLLGAVKLLPIYNFLPKQIKARRLFERLVFSTISFLFLMLLFVGISTLGSFSDYQEVAGDYEMLENRYEKHLKLFDNSDKKKLDSLHALTQLKIDASNEKLLKLLKTLTPLTSMKLESFQWEKQKNETFSILFSKKFLTLKSYYAFVKKVESFEQELTKNYPKIKLLQNSYLDDLTLKVTVTQKNRTRRRSRRGGLHE